MSVQGHEGALLLTNAVTAGEVITVCPRWQRGEGFWLFVEDGRARKTMSWKDR